MSDERAAKRRARRSGGIQAMAERIDVVLSKADAEALRQERVEANYPGSQAEFAGFLLGGMIRLARAQRQMAAAKDKLVQTATPAQVQTVLGGAR